MKTLNLFSTPVTIKNNSVDISEDDMNIINSFEYEEKANLNYFTKDYYVLDKLNSVKL